MDPCALLEKTRRKQFFFEKKNQKTFIRAAIAKEVAL
jgi:hypothetical protein